MQLELIILFQVIAFAFLALGIVPYRRDVDTGTLPLANKVIFLLMSSTLFFSLAVLGVSYDVHNCYTSTETVDGNVTTLENVCELSSVESLPVSYINTGLGWVTILLAFIIMLLAITSRKDPFYKATGEEE